MERVNEVAIIMASVVIFAFLWQGCSRRPEGVLSEKEMVSLMADLQLAEAYSNTVGMRQTTDERERLGNGVLKAHGVSKEELDSTLAWYGRNLDDYSELYEKVDKRIVSKRKSLLKEEESEEVNDLDMLWPYRSHGVLSPIGNSDSWVVSIESPSLEKGDRLEWSMRISEPVQLNGLLGVEYADGTSDAMPQVIGGKKKIEVKLLTDTGKTVKRIYGTLRVRDDKVLPIFADSIMLRRLPYDSLEYVRFRSQRHYGVPARIMPKKEEKPDTMANADAKGKSDSVKILNKRIQLQPGVSGVQKKTRHDIERPPRGKGGPVK